MSIYRASVSSVAELITFFSLWDIIISGLSRFLFYLTYLFTGFFFHTHFHEQPFYSIYVLWWFTFFFFFLIRVLQIYTVCVLFQFYVNYVWLYSMASLVSQTVKNLPTMRDTWVQSLGWEDPLEKERATHFSILAWRSPWTEAIVYGIVESDATERLTLCVLFLFYVNYVWLYTSFNFLFFILGMKMKWKWKSLSHAGLFVTQWII